jgi:hypothetical protein
MIRGMRRIALARLQLVVSLGKHTIHSTNRSGFLSSSPVPRLRESALCVFQSANDLTYTGPTEAASAQARCSSAANCLMNGDIAHGEALDASLFDDQERFATR